MLVLFRNVRVMCGPGNYVSLPERGRTECDAAVRLQLWFYWEDFPWAPFNIYFPRWAGPHLSGKLFWVHLSALEGALRASHPHRYCSRIAFHSLCGGAAVEVKEV